MAAAAPSAEAAASALPPPPPNLSYRLQKLNPLAFPKGQNLKCEMSGKPALVSLICDFVTLHFSSREMATRTWEGILCKISHVLGTILAPQPLVGSEEERASHWQLVHSTKIGLMALCNEEASKHVVTSRFELAVPAASYAIRFGTEIYGEGKLPLVPAYLRLAEANLGLLDYRQAEEYLTLANWALLKAGEASNALRSQLRRNLGKLYAAQGRYEEALRQLADDVYYSSLMVGPEHIDTSGGYFQLGNVFYSMNRIESSLAMYDKVVDVWYKCLAALLGKETRAPLSEAKGSAGVEMLTLIIKRREECAGESYIATGEAHYILGLLHQYMDELKLAQRHIRTALNIYENQLGLEHHSTMDVARSLAQIEEAALPQ